MKSAEEKARMRLYTKRVHDQRRAEGACINNATHGSAVRGGRCVACWQKKLAAERATYQTRKART